MVDEALSSASLARRLYDVALEAPGAAGFARMEKVRRASTYELCLLACEWGVDLEGPSSAGGGRGPRRAPPRRGRARREGRRGADARATAAGARAAARPEVDSPRATSFAPGLLRSQSERSTLESLTLGLARRQGRGAARAPQGATRARRCEARGGSNRVDGVRVGRRADRERRRLATDARVTEATRPPPRHEHTHPQRVRTGGAAFLALLAAPS